MKDPKWRPTLLTAARAAVPDTSSSPANTPASAEPPPAPTVTAELIPASPPATAPVTPAAAATAAMGKKGKAIVKHMAFMERLERKVNRKHMEVLSCIPLAADVDDYSEKPEGWTDRMFRIAKDARKSQRECPKYLDVSQKVVDSFKRVAAMQERDPSPQLNCDIQVFVQQNVYNYEVLEEEDKR